MEDTLVTFKTAKLAEIKGFEDTIGVFMGKHYYNYKGELDGDTIESIRHRKETPNTYASIAAPTQSLLAKWLRDTHNIHIIIQPTLTFWTFGLVNIGNPNIDLNGPVIYDANDYSTYEDALEEGLHQALSLIK